MRPKQVLPIQARVDLEAMVMKGFTTFSKVPELELHHLMQLNVIAGTLIEGRGSYPSAGMQSVYSTTPADRVGAKDGSQD